MDDGVFEAYLKKLHYGWPIFCPVVAVSNAWNSRDRISMLINNLKIHYRYVYDSEFFQITQISVIATFKVLTRTQRHILQGVHVKVRK